VPIGGWETTSGSFQRGCEHRTDAMTFESPATDKAANQSLVVLEAEARYARERYQLYRGRAYGPRATSHTRLRELERALKFAESRLNRLRGTPVRRADAHPVVATGTERSGSETS
jgi:hypothetical protein